MSHALNIISSTDAEDQLSRLLETSHDLLSLVQHENAIILEEGELSFEAYIARKINLMQGFEKEAQNLLNKLSMEKNSASVQTILIEEVKRVRDALHINSMHQINMLRRKTERSAIVDMPVNEGTVSACH